MATASAIALATAYHTTTDPRLNPYPYAHPAIHGLGLAGGTAYTQFSAPDQYEALLGRRLAPTPSHLTSRILYVPSHNDKAAHLPVYDFAKEYKETVRDEPIGSSRFKTSFGLMPKPNGDGRGSSEVSYLVDFEPLERRKSLSGPAVTNSSAGLARRKSSFGAAAGLVTHGTVSRRMLYGGAEVGLTIPPGQAPLADGAVAYTLTPSSTDVGIRAVTSFPMQPTLSRFGSSRNPWFTFTVPSLLDEERTFQWQVHPVEHGLLRYTLVELGGGGGGGDNAGVTSAAGDDDRWWEVTTDDAKGNDDGQDEQGIPYSAADEKHDKRIRAIYHNVGLGFSLSQPFSEGALLLQNELDPELEAIIVASLLGLLWRARGEENKPRRGSKGDAPPRKGSKSEGSTLARKKSVSVTNVDDEVTPPVQTGRRKSLIGKILGKK